MQDQRQNHESRLLGNVDVLMEIYRRLYGHFGPRHWWPADGPFEMIVGAILTQNVTWHSVTLAIDNLKAAGLLSLDGLLAVREEDLSPLLRPTRYHIQKARKLQAFCQVVATEHGGDLDAFLSQEATDLRRRLLDIYGIGPETADAIVLYAAGKPIFVIDAYAHRIFHRLGYFPERISYREMQSFFMGALPLDVPLYNEYHALIDALGHHICTARPHCDACPLAGLCQTGKTPDLANSGPPFLWTPPHRLKKKEMFASRRRPRISIAREKMNVERLIAPLLQVKTSCLSKNRNRKIGCNQD